MENPKKYGRIIKRTEKRAKKVEQKMDRAKDNPSRIVKLNKKHGYDYETADKEGITPDETGHWPSRVSEGPNEGLILKGRKHPTMPLTKYHEKKEGYKIVKRKGRQYSVKK